jgi:hypothetical protein
MQQFLELRVPLGGPKTCWQERWKAKPIRPDAAIHALAAKFEIEKVMFCQPPGPRTKPVVVSDIQYTSNQDCRGRQKPFPSSSSSLSLPISPSELNLPYP